MPRIQRLWWEGGRGVGWFTVESEGKVWTLEVVRVKTNYNQDGEFLLVISADK